MDFTFAITDYIERMTAVAKRLDTAEINRFLNALLDARDAGHRIYIMGNGGSGATASHMMGDLNKGLSYQKPEGKRFRAVCLNDNGSTVLALANDVSYDDVFVEQLKNFLEPGDIVLGISGSGNSENMLRAARYAKAHGNTVLAFTGYSGGALAELADIHLHVPADDMQITEDLHMMLVHLTYSVLANAE